LLPAALHGLQQYSQAGTQDARSPSIWTMSTMRAASDLGVMSPKPTVEKTVTVKYKAVSAGAVAG
jgi:hypothetical protein